MTFSKGKKSIPVRTALLLCALMAVLTGLALWQAGGGPGAKSTLDREIVKARLVDRMRADIFAVAEAEKNAHMAETDELSQEFARRARATADQVAASLANYRELVSGRPKEAELLGRVEAAFAAYRKADEEVLSLAVQNTNLKALALSFGPAAQALEEMERALAPAASPAALRALLAAQRIQALHAPHILEKTEAKMDALEKHMAEADVQARKALASLGPQAARATAAYEAHHTATQEVLRLSRLNTNVRSLALTLDRQVRLLNDFDEALRALKQHEGTELTRATR